MGAGRLHGVLNSSLNFAGPERGGTQQGVSREVLIGQNLTTKIKICTSRFRSEAGNHETRRDFSCTIFSWLHGFLLAWNDYGKVRPAPAPNRSTCRCWRQSDRFRRRVAVTWKQIHWP